MDQRARRAAFLQADDAYFTAIAHHRVAAGNLVGPIVAALHEHVGQHALDQRGRGIFAERDDPIDRREPGKHRHSILE